MAEFSYRPTAIALWLWRHHPSWSHPPAEIFARSLALRGETIPLASPGCGKILLMGRGDVQGMWPRPCPPALVPDECRMPGAICYANWSGDGYSFRPVAELPDWLKYDRTNLEVQILDAGTGRIVTGGVLMGLGPTSQ